MTRDALVIDQVPTSPQLARDAPIAVAWELVLDVVDDLHELFIREVRHRGYRTIVEGAARQLDHFAPPSDGAGFGPVMINDASLPLMRRRRGVFLRRSSS